MGSVGDTVGDQGRSGNMLCNFDKGYSAKRLVAMAVAIDGSDNRYDNAFIFLLNYGKVISSLPSRLQVSISAP